MGIFSSERKVTVSTNTVRLIENDNLPNSTQVGAIKSIFEEGDMTNFILEELSHNIAIRANRMYRYAKEHSHVGVPSEVFIQKEMGTSEVLKILQTKYGGGGTLHYSFFGVPNFYHFGWEALVAKGYNTKTNMYLGKYLDYFAIEMGDESLDMYVEDVYLPLSLSPYSGNKPWVYQDTLTEDFYPPVNRIPGLIAPRLLVVTGIQPNPLESVVDYTRVNIDMPDMVSGKDYFQACYEVDGVKHFWSYQKGKGTYPVLDSLGETVNSALGTYYPFVHFIHNKKMASREGKTNPDYLLSKRLCKYLDIQADDIYDQFESNPDIREVNQASLVFAIPANSTAEAEQHYAFEFFHGISQNSNSHLPNVSSDSSFKRKTHTAGRTLIIADKKFHMSVSYGDIIVHRKVGVIGGRGKYNSSVGQGTATYDVKNPVTGMVSTISKTGTVHKYTHQVTEFLYDEIQVVNLRVAFKVFEDYSTIGEGGSNLLLLPVDKAIIDRLPVKTREEVMGRSLRLVFNSYNIQYISFFERGPFKAFLAIAAIVFTIYSAGTGGGFMAAISAGGTAALAAIWSTVVLPILKVALVQEGVKFFVKTFGEEAALLIAIVAIAYGVYNQIKEGSALFADNLIRVGNNLISQVNASIQQNTAGVLEEMREFSEYSTDMYEKLEETAYELLNGNLLAKVPEVVFGEPPQSYFNRTVHSGNIGVQSIAAVSNYVPLALTLPSFNDTIQGIKHE